MKKSTEIQNELNSISEVIITINDVNPQSLPDGYFDNFETTLISKLDNSGKINNPILIPENYFNYFPSQLISKLDAKKTTPFFTAKKIISAAAIIIIVLSIYLALNPFGSFVNQRKSTAFQDFQKKQQHLNFESELSKIDNKDMLAYLSENDIDIRAAFIASLDNTDNIPNVMNYFENDRLLEKYFTELQLQKSNGN